MAVAYEFVIVCSTHGQRFTRESMLYRMRSSMGLLDYCVAGLLSW